jgi:hypothetical protein
MPPPDLPVGAVYPPSQHAVVVSLPTIASVVGYETGCPTIKRAVTVGYPRFVQHRLVCRLREHAASRLRDGFGVPAAAVIPVCGRGAARALLSYARVAPSSSSSSGILSHSFAVDGDAFFALARGLPPAGGAQGIKDAASAPAADSDAGRALLADLVARFDHPHSGVVAPPPPHLSLAPWALVVLAPDESDAVQARARDFQQHTGCRLSSRQAQDVLASLGLLEEGEGGEGEGSDQQGRVEPRAPAPDEDAETVRAAVRSVFLGGGALARGVAAAPSSPSSPAVGSPPLVHLYNSGMGGFTTLFNSIAGIWAGRCGGPVPTVPAWWAEAASGAETSPSPSSSCCSSSWRCSRHPGGRHRDTWLQLGWLYLDTTEVMRKMAAPACAECDALEREGEGEGAAQPASPPSSPLPPGVHVPGHGLVQVLDINDEAAFAAALIRFGPRLAGVVTEAPTNPLVKTADLARVSGLVRARAPGALVVLDPTMAGLGNVGNAVLTCADAVCVSLTKYAASRGDVMAGAVVLNPSSPACAVLAPALARQSRDDNDEDANGSGAGGPTMCGGFHAPWCQALYPRDLSRLALEIQRADAVVRAMNRNTCAVARWLEAEAGKGEGSEGLPVRHVHWAYDAGPCARNFAALSAAAEVCGEKGEDGAVKEMATPGSMLTLELQGTWAEVGEEQGCGGEQHARPALLPSSSADVDDASHSRRERILAAFYDACPMVKGPSFGTTFSLQCPFMYLAHYDLVCSEEGRRHLYAHGLNPYLVRISVGCEEDVEEVKGALRTGLRAARAELERQAAGREGARA